MKEKVQRLALFVQIADVLRGEIGSKYVPGQRLPSDSELAVRFEVSGVTIRQALLALGQEGLLVRRQGSGTYVADRLPQQHIALYTELDLTCLEISPFFPLIMGRLRDLLTKQGFATRCYSGRLQAAKGDLDVSPGSIPPTCEEFMEAVAANRLRGVVALAAHSHSSWREPLAARAVPVVGSSPKCDGCVRHDVNVAAREAVDRLVAQRRRRIALLDWHPVWASSFPTAGQTFRDGFTERMQYHGLSVSPHWVRGELHRLQAGAGWEGFRSIWTAKSDERPDALIVADDMLLKDVAMAVLELDVRVPEQLLILAHSNRQARVPVPFPVLRMEYDIDAYAEALGRLLVQALTGGKIDAQTLLPATWLWTSGMRETAGVDSEKSAEAIVQDLPAQQQNT